MRAHKEITRRNRIQLELISNPAARAVDRQGFPKEIPFGGLELIPRGQGLDPGRRGVQGVFYARAKNNHPPEKGSINSIIWLQDRLIKSSRGAP